MINLHESMVPGRDRTRDPWICSQTRICNQTRYLLRYAARYTIIVPSPWGYGRMTVRCPYNFMCPARASCSDLEGSLQLLQESKIIDSLKLCIVLTITMWCPYGDRTMLLLCVYGLWLAIFFKFVIMRS